ncbi:MAG: hypothetical protein LBQ67_00105 [Treponema sp.]|jgi:hypothetical protein|nr:hypothetical protein [Treponema sp.]
MKRFILFVLLSIIGMAVFAQSEELAIRSAEFDQAATITAQLTVTTAVETGNYTGAEAFYAKALHRLIEEYPSISTTNDRDKADKIALKLAPKLGDVKYGAASVDLWQAVMYLPNPDAKAAALAALGKVDEGKAFLPQVVQLVKDWNTRPQPDRETRDRVERLISGAIIALENYKDPLGYLPVLFVSNGWYMAAVREQALAALPNIEDDPTELLIGAIRSSGYTYEAKIIALNTSENFSPSNEKKASVAAEALAESWRTPLNAPLKQRVSAVMRKQALRMLGRYGSQDGAVYQSINKSYIRAWDREERLLAIGALKTMASDESVRLLTGYLRDLTERRLFGPFTVEDGISARAIISALGEIGNPAAMVEVRMVQELDAWNYSNFSSLATNALRKLR